MKTYETTNNPSKVTCTDFFVIEDVLAKQAQDKKENILYAGIAKDDVLATLLLQIENKIILRSIVSRV